MTHILSKDQLGHEVKINFPPQRIVSLVPSQTEFLFDIGLEKEIVGITRFCIHPSEEVKGKEKIGGTKRFDFENIKSLQPDLIIGNKEENYQEGIEELRRSYPVWMSDIYTLENAYSMMREVSRITGKEKEGEALVEEIGKGFSTLSTQNSELKTVAYFIWRKPYMVAASGTFIDHLLGVFGMKNVYADLSRYPEIQPEILAERKPDFILLSSEPYSFAEKHFEEFQSFCPASKVVLVNGEMFSWYGSRLKHTSTYFRELKQELLLP